MIIRTLAATAAASILAYALPAQAAQYVVLRIYNDARVPITQLNDRQTGQASWGINDLADMGSTANPYAAPVRPIAPGRFFYIRYEESAYDHCPMMRDVRVVFANGTVKIARAIDACKYDVHFSKSS
ncbi:MAG TPA: hypothetical protein VKT72_07035 [Candidatus Baltobacteraceae bacterium]|nr:hypothetical protein [Candidatus Baltobacteraceae bacterium]